MPTDETPTQREARRRQMPAIYDGPTDGRDRGAWNGPSAGEQYVTSRDVSGVRAIIADSLEGARPRTFASPGVRLSGACARSSRPATRGPVPTSPGCSPTRCGHRRSSPC